MPKIGDVFNPYRMFAGNFVPEAISRYKSLPSGSKLIYARLCRFKGERGEAYPAIPTLAEEVGLSERQAWRYVSHLVDQGFIQVIERKGQSSVYEFLWHPCFEGEVGSGRAKLAGEPVPLTAPLLTSAVNGTTTSAVNDTTPVPLTADEENQGRESIEENHPPIIPQPILDLSDSVDVFLKNSWGRERRVRLKFNRKQDRQLLDRCEEIETKYGATGFRAAALAYLADESPWLKEKQWPAWNFLNQIERYLPDTPHDGNGAGKAEAPDVEAGGGAITHAGAAAAQPIASLPCPARMWNEIVTAGEPVEQWGRRDAPLLSTMQDSEFLAALPKVLQRCQIAHQSGEDVNWLTFRWLLRKDKAGVDNWYKVYTGDLAWATAKKTKPARQTGAEVYDAYLEKLEAGDEHAAD